MRPIKYQVYDTKRKIMEDVGAIDWAGGLIISVHTHTKKLYFQPDREIYILRQFTGLLDKNGKEIYEGDIVTWWDGPNESDWNPRLAVVEFSPELAFYAMNVKDYSNTGKYGAKEGYGHKFGFSNFIYTDTEEHLQVIGNIYENPELLSK